jgi:hypothetical protein
VVEGIREILFQFESCRRIPAVQVVRCRRPSHHPDHPGEKPVEAGAGLKKPLAEAKNLSVKAEAEELAKEMEGK